MKLFMRIAAVCLAVVAPSAPAQPAPQPVALRPGIVIDGATGVAYVMAAPAGVAAVDLSTGGTRWTSTAADKPLALVGNLLVAQVEPKRRTTTLAVATLDTRADGRRVSRDSAALNPGVRVSLGETLDGTFSLNAQPSGADVLLHWRFESSPIRGMSEEREAVAPAVRRAAPAGAPVSSGVFRLRVGTGTLTRLNAGLAALPRAPRWVVPAGEKIRGAAPTQYESADGRNVVASERIADDRVWDKYRWTVFDRATGRRLGEFRKHIPFSPYVVRDSLVIFETTPYALAGQPAEPAKLRATSLSSGREVWSVEVRELQYRGPMPP